MSRYSTAPTFSSSSGQFMANALIIAISSSAVVGSNTEPSKLRYARRDAERLARCLIDKFDYDQSRIMTMSDHQKPTHDLYPSKDNILRQITRLRRDLPASCEGRAFLWYSGHGIDGGSDGDAYYGIVAADDKTITNHELARELKKMPKHVQLTTFFDCCYSPFVLNLPHIRCNQFTYTMPMARSQEEESWTVRRSHPYSSKEKEPHPDSRRSAGTITAAEAAWKSKLPPSRQSTLFLMDSGIRITDSPEQMSRELEPVSNSAACTCLSNLLVEHRRMIKICSAINLAFESPRKETTTSIFLDFLETNCQHGDYPTAKSVMHHVNNKIYNIHRQISTESKDQNPKNRLELDRDTFLKTHGPTRKQAIMISSSNQLDHWLDEPFML